MVIPDCFANISQDEAIGIMCMKVYKDIDWESYTPVTLGNLLSGITGTTVTRAMDQGCYDPRLDNTRRERPKGYR